MGGNSRRRGGRDATIITIADGPIEVELLPDLGARVHRLRVFGHNLLRTPDAPEVHIADPFGWGAFVMAPWCNRIAAAPTRIDGQVVTPVSNFADASAIHGRVYAIPWQELDDGTLRVRDAGDGWPWPYETTLRVSIRGTILVIEQSLTNLAATTMPAGLGLHPWFKRPIEVRIDARQVLPTNIDPLAKVESASGALDLRSLRPMPDDLDAAWLGLGDPAVELHWPTLSVGASLRAWSDAGLCIVAASPRAVSAVAIEPQTHAPHGLRRYLSGEPAGLTPLGSGATMRLTTELAFGRPQGWRAG